jgi:hypothetical protein
MAAFEKSCRRCGHVGAPLTGPKPPIGDPLLDHLVGAHEHDGRHVETQRLGGPEVELRDANGRALAYVYSRANAADAMQAKVLTEDEARRIAVNIAKLPGLLSREE